MFKLTIVLFGPFIATKKIFQFSFYLSMLLLYQLCHLELDDQSFWFLFGHLKFLSSDLAACKYEVESEPSRLPSEGAPTLGLQLDATGKMKCCSLSF